MFADKANFRLEIKELVKTEYNIAIVTYVGRVVTGQPIVLSNHCEMQIDDFPFDIQNCDITIRMWSYPTHEVNIKPWNVSTCDSFGSDFSTLYSGV